MAFLDNVGYERLDTDSEKLFAYERKVYRGEGRCTELRWHEQMEIKYVLSGHIDINLGTNIVSASAGDVIVVNPYEYHANQVEPGDAVEYHLACVDVSKFFCGNAMEKLFLDYVGGVFRFKNLISGDAEISRLALSFFESLADADALPLSFGLFITLFAKLLSHKEEGAALNARKKASQRKREILSTALSFVHEHYKENVSVEDIAGACYISTAHFCRLFKEMTDETPVSYINQFRVNKATSLLQHSSLSVHEIAFRVGFRDEAYFSRCFKRYKGKTPTEFLKRHRG